MKASTVLLLLVMIACGYRPLRAQDIVEAPRFAVKWSPLHLIYFYPSLQVAIEHRLTKKWNLQYDLGWVLDYANADSEDFTDKRGFRGIAEARYYLPSPKKIPFYIAGEVYLSRVWFDRSQVAGYNCETGDCSYFEYVSYKVKHYHEGVGIKGGLLLFPGWNRNRTMFFDFNGGLAWRNISYSEKGKPATAGIRFYDNGDPNIFAPSENDRQEMRLVLGIRIGYRFF